MINLHYDPKDKDCQIQCPVCDNRTLRLWPEYDGLIESGVAGQEFLAVSRGLFCDTCNKFVTQEVIKNTTLVIPEVRQ